MDLVPSFNSSLTISSLRNRVLFANSVAKVFAVYVLGSKKSKNLSN